MKPQFRVLGIDDGPFTFEDRTVPVIGVVVRKGYVDAVMRTGVMVDGPPFPPVRLSASTNICVRLKSRRRKRR